MRKENILVVVIICIAVVSVMMYKNSGSSNHKELKPIKDVAHARIASGIDWQAYEQGMALAKKQSKHIFLYFHADWCTYCRKLKKTTFQEKEVLTYLKDNFISISVDTDQNNELATQWKVKGLPTLWFLTPDNSKINHIPGYLDKEQFLNILKYIHTQNYEKMSLNEFVKTI